jgi:hypothetical protein
MEVELLAMSTSLLVFGLAIPAVGARSRRLIVRLITRQITINVQIIGGQDFDLNYALLKNGLSNLTASTILSASSGECALRATA